MINYLFSGVDKEKGFNEEQAKYLKKDITNNLTISFIASCPSDFDINDYFLKKTVDYFNKIDISFKEIYLIDKRMSEIDAKTYLETSDVIYLLGGDPKLEREFIKEYKLDSVLKKKESIIIGVSAGSMNQADFVVYEDNELIKYDGLGLTDIYVYPHFKTDSLETIQEVLRISKVRKVYALPNDSFIRIKDKSIEMVGEYYVLGDGL